MAVATVAHKAFFAGGVDSTGNASSVVDIYHARNGRWSTARLSKPRSGVGAVGVDGAVLFAGGETVPLDVSSASRVVDIYDSRSGKWSTTALPRPCTDLKAVATGHKAIFYGGQWSPSDGEPNLDIFIYDLRTGRWTTRVPKDSNVFRYIATVAGRDVLFPREFGPIDVYHIHSGKWTTLQAPGDQFFFDNALSVGGRAIFEGSGAAGTGLVFDTVSGSWISGQNLPAALDMAAQLSRGARRCSRGALADIRTFPCSQPSPSTMPRRIDGPVRHFRTLGAFPVLLRLAMTHCSSLETSLTSTTRALESGQRPPRRVPAVFPPTPLPSSTAR
jgi:hypothetical protein